jgi:hypothetical protein
LLFGLIVGEGLHYLRGGLGIAVGTMGRKVSEVSLPLGDEFVGSLRCSG